MLKTLKGLRNGRQGITGLETAIILIAFVVVAAVFAYTVLSAGIFSTQKSQETIYSGLQQTASTMEIKGGVLLRNRVVDETVGTGDGSDTTFYVRYAPVLADSQTIYIDGVAQAETTDYTFTDATGLITFLAAPASGEVITADYRAASSKVATVSFVVSNSAAGGAIDLTTPSRDDPADGQPSSSSTHKAVLSYWDKNQKITDVEWFKSELGYGDGDDLLEPGEQMEITVTLRALTTKLDKDTAFNIEFKPAEGGVLSFQRTTPHKIDPVMDLH
jgi:flagellin-like protein